MQKQVCEYILSSPRATLFWFSIGAVDPETGEQSCANILAHDLHEASFMAVSWLLDKNFVPMTEVNTVGSLKDFCEAMECFEALRGDRGRLEQLSLGSDSVPI